MRPWFQRPYRIWHDDDHGDGWYFIAFRRLWRVRRWRVYEWRTE